MVFRGPLQIHQDIPRFRPIPHSNGYKLMVTLPVGFREDSTYGVLMNGVRPGQQFHLSSYYMDDVTYYNLPRTCAME